MRKLLTLLSGGGITPVSYPECALWLDAQQFSSLTFNGSDISGWQNKGNAGAGNASQGTASLQPLYVASAINGKPAVQFYDDSTAKQLSIADHAAFDFGAGGFTYFSVVQRVQDLGPECIFGKWETTGNQREFMNRISGTDKNVTFYSTNGTAETGPSTTESFVIGTAAIACGHWDGSNVISTQINNFAPVTSTGITAVFNGTSPVTIGSFGAAGSAPYAGHVGEIIFYNRLLSAADRASLIAYLSAKWQIAL